MAQRWHDTDHGIDRGEGLRRSAFVEPVDEPEREWVSSCYCCCEICDPDYEEPRPNPFWSRVQARVST